MREREGERVRERVRERVELIVVVGALAFV